MREAQAARAPGPAARVPRRPSATERRWRPRPAMPVFRRRSRRLSPGAAVAVAGPRRPGVQVLLLTLGVVLISITAIVFLFVAYLVASLEVRSVIIAVASVLVLGVAWLLRARRLPGTAEGVASVAVVLLLLDVWIVRENGLFGTDALNTAAYTRSRVRGGGRPARRDAGGQRHPRSGLRGRGARTDRRVPTRVRDRPRDRDGCLARRAARPRSSGPPPSSLRVRPSARS